MLLRQLVDYAERLEREDPEGRLPPRYQKVGIRWIINLDSEGKSIGKPSRTTNGLEGRQEGPKLFVAPQLVRSVGIRAKLLADNGEYVLGIGREDSPPEKVEKRHEAFKEAVRVCAEATDVPAIWAITRFLETLNLEGLNLPEDLAPDDRLTFSVDGTIPIDLPEIRAYWAGSTGDTPGATDQKGILEAECLISGEYGPVMNREPVKIKGIPGGRPSGTNLISANKHAYESYGLSASQVAPVKVEYAEKYANALNRLLKDDHTHLRVGPIVYAFWTKKSALPPVVEAIARPDVQNPMLAALFSGQPIDLSPSDRSEQVKKEISSPWAGREFEALRNDAFYAVSLSASGGRVVVRDHLTTTVGQVKEKLRDYFEAQRMVDSGSESESGRPLGVYALAASLYRDANKEMSPATPVHLLEFALHGTSLPFGFLQQLVRRNQIERRVTRPRAVLTKMVLISRGKEMIDMERRNTDRPETAYHLGRLLAILEKIQKDAQPGINATIVDRFYGSASTTPAWVFGRLISGAQNNLGKLRKSRPAIHTISEKRLQEVLAHIQDFPPVLKVEDQALFGLGYYHEKAYHWEQIMAHAKDKKTAAEQTQNENPKS